MTKPKAKKEKVSVEKPKKSVKKSATAKPKQGYEMEAKVNDQDRNMVRLALCDRNNVGVDVYGLVKVMRGDVVAMAEVHQQVKALVGKRTITLSREIAASLSVVGNGKKVAVQRPTESEIRNFHEGLARQREERQRQEEDTEEETEGEN